MMGLTQGSAGEKEESRKDMCNDYVILADFAVEYKIGISTKNVLCVIQFCALLPNNCR